MFAKNYVVTQNRLANKNTPVKACKCIRAILVFNSSL